MRAAVVEPGGRAEGKLMSEWKGGWRVEEWRVYVISDNSAFNDAGENTSDWYRPQVRVRFVATVIFTGQIETFSIGEEAVH